MPATADPPKKPPAVPDHMVRVVSLPVRAVVGPDGEDDPRVLDVLRPVWRLSTDLANWGIGELVRRDVRRTPDMTKLPPYNPEAMFGTAAAKIGRKAVGDKPSRAAGDRKVVGNLYQLWNRTADMTAWAGASQPASDILRAVEHTWKTHKEFGRFAVVWKGDARAAYHRYPYPFPCPKGPVKSPWVRLARDERGRPCVDLYVPGGRRTFVLATGAEFRRQLAEFDQLAADPARLCQVRITGRSRGGRLVGAMLRITGRFPVRPKGSDLACVVRTDPAALLVLEIPGRPASVFNADDLRRAHLRHKVHLRRVGEDLKFEKRAPAARRAGVRVGVAKRCDKHANRLRSGLQMIVAQVAGLCERNGVGTVVYDDAVRTFMGTDRAGEPIGFPWYDLKTTLANKLIGLGIGVISSDQPTGG